nr:MAG TPA: Protein of unknown function (DUF3789) [Caudoviricetes sp.]
MMFILGMITGGSMGLLIASLCVAAGRRKNDD